MKYEFDNCINMILTVKLCFRTQHFLGTQRQSETRSHFSAISLHVSDTETQFCSENKKMRHFFEIRISVLL